MAQSRRLSRGHAGPGRASITKEADTPFGGRWLAAIAGRPASVSLDARTFLHSNSVRARARAVIPGGASALSADNAVFPLLSPGYIRSGSGCRVVDADGRSFIEFGSGTCPVILGHAHPAVTEAVEAAVRASDCFSRASLIEPEAAEALTELIPGAEMVRYFSSEADALMAAIALARAATGRQRIIRFNGAFGEGCCADDAPEQTQPGDIDCLSACLASRSDPVAALVIDCADGDEPSARFLSDTIAAARRHGALIILDETTTGFRWAPGGAQDCYGCAGDLAVFGRGGANGFPLAALAGVRELMRLSSRTEQPLPGVMIGYDRHGAAAHCLAALLAVIRTIRSEDICTTLHERGLQLRNGIRAIATERGVADHFVMSGRACRPVFQTLDAASRPSADFRALFLQETIRRGVLAPTFAPSRAHDSEAIERTLEAVDGALDIYARALADGVGAFLVGRPGGVDAAN